MPWVLADADGPIRTGAVLERREEKRAQLVHVQLLRTGAVACHVGYPAEFDSGWVELDERKDVFGYHRRDRSIFPHRIVPELSPRHQDYDHHVHLMLCV